MGRIGSKDTAPEMAVRRMLHALGFRYVLHDRRLPGRPDLVFPARKKVVFVHGCFWHSHDCGRGFKPQANRELWRAKLDANMARDRQNRALLESLGWQVMVVWECSTVGARLARLEEELVAFLRS